MQLGSPPVADDDGVIGGCLRHAEGIRDEAGAGLHFAAHFFIERRHRFGRQERIDDIVIGKIQLPEIAVAERQVGAFMEARP